jgi:hypothetical protein
MYSAHMIYMSKRVAELKQEPSGCPPHGLDWFEDTYQHHYPADLRTPYLFATLDSSWFGGQIMLEWSLEPWAPSLEVDLFRKVGNWHALNLTTDQEVAKQEIDLADADEWSWIVEQIQLMGGAT